MQGESSAGRPTNSTADHALRLAGLPKTVLENAQLRADQLKVETAKKNAEALAKRTRHLLSDLSTSSLNARETIQNIQILHKSINLLA